MKLSEIIPRVVKTPDNEFTFEATELFEELGVNQYDDVELEQYGLVAYFIGKWLCTDTYVGYAILFLNNEAVACLSKPFRRSSVVFTWIGGLSTKKRVFDFCIDNIRPALNKELEEVRLDKDIGEGYQLDYSAQLLERMVVYTPTGELAHVIGKFSSTKEISKWGKVQLKFADDTTMYARMNDVVVPYIMSNKETENAG